MDAGNSATTDLNIADNGQSVRLQPTGVIDASQTLRINNSFVNPRAGVLIEGDLAVNTGNYAIRMHGGGDLTSVDNYSTIGRSVDSHTEIAAAGGWGPRLFFSAKTDFVSISNDNDNGRPIPIPGADAVVHVYNGLNTQFGTEADPRQRDAQRRLVLYPLADLMADIQDTDLFLVNRNNTTSTLPLLTSWLKSKTTI